MVTPVQFNLYHEAAAEARRRTEAGNPYHVTTLHSIDSYWYELKEGPDPYAWSYPDKGRPLAKQRPKGGSNV